MAVAGEVEEDRALHAGLVGGPRITESAVDGVCGLGSRDDALAAGERHGRSEDVVLEVGLGSNQAVAYELRNERRSAVVAQPAGVDRGRDERVPERVHRHERGQLAGVAEVVRKKPARQGWAGGGLAGEEADLTTGD